MLVAFASAATIALLAFAARLLTAGGAVAATLVGAVAVRAGAGWVALLLVFFFSSNGLSRWRRVDRAQLTGDVIAKGDRRDAMQVLANGAVFAAAAVGSLFHSGAAWQALGAGAIAAAMADTWATEVGTVAGGNPRLLTTWTAVAPGVSGGVTLSGTMAGLAGALLAAAVSQLVHLAVPPVAVGIGGITGMVTDSLLGATLQERRWCESCGSNTERRRHRCGATTVRRGGVRGFTNDLVNVASILAGAVTTWALT